jgi:hypothetical protein
MASKISASSALEGSFTEDGLAALAGGEDLTTELARTLTRGHQTPGRLSRLGEGVGGEAEGSSEARGRSALVAVASSVA